MAHAVPKAHPPTTSEAQCTPSRMRLTPTSSVRTVETARMYARSDHRSRVLATRTPTVKNTIADMLAWPLGKLSPETTKSLNTGSGRRRPNASLNALTRTDPVTTEVAPQNRTRR